MSQSCICGEFDKMDHFSGSLPNSNFKIMPISSDKITQIMRHSFKYIMVMIGGESGAPVPELKWRSLVLLNENKILVLFHVVFLFRYRGRVKRSALCRSCPLPELGAFQMNNKATLINAERNAQGHVSIHKTTEWLPYQCSVWNRHRRRKSKTSSL